MASGPACQAYWSPSTDAVFDATVVGLEAVTREELFAGTLQRRSRYVVTLDVRQAWKGVAPGTIQVVTDTSTASCGFEFHAGRRYLVFARQLEPRQLEVSGCSATREFDGTGNDAAFLASLAEPGRGGRIFGKIDPPTARIEGTPPPAPVPTDLPVTLTWQGQSRTTRSANGTYEFSGLAPGTYEVTATAPEGFVAGDWREPLTIPNGHACVERNVSLGHGGRIIGQAIDGKGRGVSGVRIDIIGSESRLPVPHESWAARDTASDGFFELRWLPPGRYLVGVNFQDHPTEYRPYPMSVYPGGGAPPHTIEVSPGQVVDLGRWELPPPVPVVRIAGTVVWRDGTPAAGVHVGLWDETGSPPGDWARGAGSKMSDMHGRFTIEARVGRTYSVRAIYDRTRLPIESLRIQTTPDLQSIRIVILRDPPELVKGRTQEEEGRTSRGTL
jgi:hypothetical protein